MSVANYLGDDKLLFTTESIFVNNIYSKSSNVKVADLKDGEFNLMNGNINDQITNLQSRVSDLEIITGTCDLQTSILERLNRIEDFLVIFSNVYEIRNTQTNELITFTKN